MKKKQLQYLLVDFKSLYVILSHLKMLYKSLPTLHSFLLPYFIIKRIERFVNCEVRTVSKIGGIAHSVDEIYEAIAEVIR